MSSQEEKYLNYYEVLELEDNATLADINRAYKKLKELYTTESIVTDPIEDEFGQEEREEIVNQIEEAYKALVLYVVQKDRAQKLPEEEIPPEDTAEEDAPDLEKEISDIVDETKKEIDDEEEEVLLLEEEIPDEESIKTITAPPTSTRSTSASSSPPPPISPSPEKLNDKEDSEKPVEKPEFAEKKEELPPPKPPKDSQLTESNEKKEQSAVHIHENHHDHEPIHIELPEKEDEIPEKTIELNEPPVEEEPPEEEVAPETPDRKGVWDETLFEKDLNEIKKELTKDITKDIKNQLTISGDNSGKTEPFDKDNTKEIPIKGRILRKFREKLGMGIHEMALSTKIHYKILVNIEKERFAKLPEPGYLRWYLMTYAKKLALDPKRVADEYMKRYRQWEKHQKGLP